ncbi:unnamed protein product [Phytomonas sp. EM1]|nr:unnamed protein product [Phytomonas sp. EM1]|eukprot:CCW60584.1 unnamed protein product [Phytomonas sp. isolate EM1]
MPKVDGVSSCTYFLCIFVRIASTDPMRWTPVLSRSHDRKTTCRLQLIHDSPFHPHDFIRGTPFGVPSFL